MESMNCFSILKSIKKYIFKKTPKMKAQKVRASYNKRAIDHKDNSYDGAIHLEDDSSNEEF